MKIDVDWVKWADRKPEDEGKYLTLWSDGDMELFALTEEELRFRVVKFGNVELTHWAEVEFSSPTK